MKGLFLLLKQFLKILLSEHLMRPKVTFNDLKGQNHIAYDSSLYTMSMHAKNQVNRCSG